MCCGYKQHLSLQTVYQQERCLQTGVRTFHVSKQTVYKQVFTNSVGKQIFRVHKHCLQTREIAVYKQCLQTRFFVFTNTVCKQVFTNRPCVQTV